MRLTIAEINDLLAAHKALDGHDRIVRDGNNERVVKQSYDIKFGLRMQIAENIEALEAVVKRFSRERDKLLMEASGGETTLAANSAAAQSFAKKMHEASQDQHEVTLQRIDFVELDGDNNPYPPSVLAGLLPIKKKAADTVKASRGPKAA